MSDNQINWSDKQYILTAVKKDGLSLLYASEELQNDKEVVFAAVIQNGYSILYASNELKHNKEVFLAAVSQHSYAMQFASSEFKNDKEIVLTAMNQNRSSLQFASNKLQNDFDLLNLLRDYHIDKNINDYFESYRKWYKERMNVLDIINQQELLEKNIPNNNAKAKTRKF